MGKDLKEHFQKIHYKVVEFPNNADLQHTINALKSHLAFFQHHCPELIDKINPATFIDESAVESLFGTLKGKSPNNVTMRSHV